MHVEFSYHHVVRNPQLDKAVDTGVQKLETLLARFSPDLIHLHGLLEYNTSHPPRPVCSLNLWLPTAQLHSRQENGTVLDALQACFNQLVGQVKKHKQVLRREGVWKRRRYKFQQEARELQAGEAPPKDRLQFRDYLEQVLPQLERFVARELGYREMAGQLRPGEAQREEIINEVVARTLDNVRKDSPSSVPFHNVLSEAIRVLNHPLGKPAPEKGVSPESEEAAAPAPRAQRRVRPGRVTEKERARPAVTSTDPVDRWLSSMDALHRQVYVLRALEGFSWEETAEALGLSVQQATEIFQQVSGEVSTKVRQERAAGGSPPKKRE